MLLQNDPPQFASSDPVHKLVQQPSLSPYAPNEFEQKHFLQDDSSMKNKLNFQNFGDNFITLKNKNRPVLKRQSNGAGNTISNNSQVLSREVEHFERHFITESYLKTNSKSETSLTQVLKP
ncbi:hypothetical protein HELRODRAFT_178135 [Helobdella robusta]|uniref:Uncharacterized protein n=1 Tax=Helobdella robusta TaxID=6412 RepID=T1FCT5_HELRO|nr:hypothetical protein HELRODRAFT_178135 [Helobdella robusta]ESN97350.1 hypothetical protein HELRODRAFT_178135 [Helobdella robusta]